MRNINYIYLLTPLICLACTNPFNTRDIEEPDITNQSDIFDQPTNNETVLSNFQYALIQKNISNYLKCFVDGSTGYPYLYRFIPDPSVEPEKFRTWNLLYEETYLRTVFTQSGAVSLEYLDDISFTNITQSQDSVQTNSFRYKLIIAFEEETVTFTGTARMKLVKNQINELWAIYFWEDTKAGAEESLSWSSLKANFKN